MRFSYHQHGAQKSFPLSGEKTYWYSYSFEVSSTLCVCLCREDAIQATLSSLACAEHRGCAKGEQVAYNPWYIHQNLRRLTPQRHCGCWARLALCHDSLNLRKVNRISYIEVHACAPDCIASSIREYQKAGLVPNSIFLVESSKGKERTPAAVPDGRPGLWCECGCLI